VRQIGYALVFVCALDVHALSRIVFFPDPQDAKNLQVQFVDGTVLAQAENECTTPQACTDRIWILHKAKGDDTKKTVNSATVLAEVPGRGGQINLTLADPVLDPSDLYIIVADLIVMNGTKQKSAGWQEFPIAPQIEQSADANRPTIHYLSLTRLLLDNTPAVRRSLSQKLSVTDPDDPTLRYDVYITEVETPGAKPSPSHFLTLAGIPRGKKVKVALSGVEQFNGKDVGVSPTTIAPVAFPKGRDDAAFFVNGSIDTNDIKGDKKYKLDTRIHPSWVVGAWEIGPTLDGTIGNKLSGAPNSAFLSADFRRFFAAPDSKAFIPTQSLLTSVLFRTDKKFDNRDFEADLAWEPLLRPFEGMTLEQRRAVEKANGGIPQSIHWGFRLRPSIALEGGRHIASTSPDVDNKQFMRIRGKVTAMLQWETWTFSASGESRHLFTDEVVLDKDGQTLLRTDRQDRSNIRLDLSYDLGDVALTVTRINGRQPPAFSPTRSTSFGVTLKF
jgi:hypothetical protein